MTVLRSILLFAVAAVAEIGGAWLVWQGVREQKGWAWIGAGVIALGLYGFVATLQPDANFGRILAAYRRSSSSSANIRVATNPSLHQHRPTSSSAAKHQPADSACRTRKLAPTSRLRHIRPIFGGCYGYPTSF